MMLNFKHSHKQSILGLLISALIMPGLQAGRSNDRYHTTTKVGLVAVAALACYALYRYYHRPEMVYDAIPVLDTTAADGVVPMTDLITDASQQEAMARAKDAEQGVVWGEPIIDAAIAAANQRPISTGAVPTVPRRVVAHVTTPVVAKADPVVGDSVAKSRPAAVPAPAVPNSVAPVGAHVAVPVAMRTGVSAAARQAANTALFKACRTANLTQISAAVAAGADINAVNTLDYTPLMLAVENNADVAILQGLINLGAQVSQANSVGQTVFYSLIGKPAGMVAAALRIFNIALRAEMPAAVERRRFVLERRYSGQTLMELAAINYNNDQRGSAALDGDRDQVIAALQALL